jgi:hypothetical protein
VTPAERGGVIRMIIDDESAALLREAAQQRGIDVEVLMAKLLAASSRRVDELLPPCGERTVEKR